MNECWAQGSEKVSVVCLPWLHFPLSVPSLYAWNICVGTTGLQGCFLGTKKKSVCYFLDCLVWPITITSEFVPWLLASQSQAITVTVLRPSSELSCHYFQTFCDFTFSQNQHTLLGGGASLLCDMNLYHPLYSNLSVKGLL